MEPEPLAWLHVMNGSGVWLSRSTRSGGWQEMSALSMPGGSWCKGGTLASLSPDSDPILFHNLMATLEGKDLHSFDPGGDYLLIFNLGDGTGVLHKWRIQFGGRLAFIIKDYIDRKFMRKFQSLE